MSVVIETTLGDVTVDLFVEERPQTCLNFLKLCKIKYYNMCLFHSVTENFLAQTGDPNGKGDGGESVFGLINGRQHRLYQGEKMPKIKHDQSGLLSMVSHGNGLFGSQFVITLSDNLSSLDQEHCVFGQVVEGAELLVKLNEAITDSTHRPYQDIRITHTVILDDPFPDPEGLLIPPQSPVIPASRDAAYSRIPADESLSENYSQQELDEMVQQREAAARATILEMVGDLPDADAAPPENVLFVCKLNPVTTDHDLSIIFSRFGKVKSCEVIRDQVTGDSLQYAFVEFENQKACEDAYFKMDNVLIDDRRIHVDFSQSVAKLKWRGKGRGVIHLDGNKDKRKDSRRDEIKQEKPKTNDRFPRHFRNNHQVSSDKHEKNIRNINHKIKTESRVKMEKKVEKRRGKTNKKKRKRSLTSSSSESSCDSSSSLDSSDSDYKKKKSRSRKVLVVVKTPRRNKPHKKQKKIKSKKYESDTDSEEERIKRKKKKTKKQISDSSSDCSELIKKKRKTRKREPSTSSSEDVGRKMKRKRKRKASETSDDSSDDKIKSRGKKRLHETDSSSESEDVRKKKKKSKSKYKNDKSKDTRKTKKKHKTTSESSTSTSD